MKVRTANARGGGPLAWLCVLIAVILVACRGGGTSTSSGTTTSTRPSLPSTPVTGVLAQTFASKGTAFDPAKLGFQPGSVEADWYVSNGSWVVYYKGLDLSRTGPLCPGNSIRTAAGFAHESDSPTSAGACERVVSRVALPPVGVRVCDGKVLYLTAIPATETGTLYGTIERGQPDGTVQGVTSQAASSASAPRIDLDALACKPVAAPVSLTKAEAGQAYLAAVAAVNSAASAFSARLRAWTSSTSKAQAQSDAAPLVVALDGVQGKLAEIATAFPPAATALRDAASAAVVIRADLVRLPNINAGLSVAAFTQQYNADIAKLIAASNVVRSTLGLPPTAS